MVENAVTFPAWKGSVFEKYAYKFVGKNQRRVRRRMDFEDCMQAAGEVFARCKLSYERKNDAFKPALFMALYTFSLANEFHSLAKDCGKGHEAEQAWAEDAQRRNSEYEGEASTLSIALTEVSEELRIVLTTIAEAPGEILDVLLEETEDATWSRRLCRLCRTPRLNETVIAELRTLLTGGVLEKKSAYSKRPALIQRNAT
jgi:hypothetical protein